MSRAHQIQTFLRGYQAVPVVVAPERRVCPTGDPCCPCQDGDACHYEDTWGIREWARAMEAADA